MTECPVCRHMTFQAAEVCPDCQTPLAAARTRGRSWSRMTTLLLPGLSHLWLGHLYTGLLALLGSLFGLIWLVGPVMATGTSTVLLRWGVFWLLWVGGWTWHVRRIRRRFVSLPDVAVVLFVGLLVSNFFALVLNVLALVVRSRA